MYDIFPSQRNKNCCEERPWQTPSLFGQKSGRAAPDPVHSVLDCHAESYILHPHPAENLKSMVSTFEPVRQPAYLIIRLFQSFNRDPNTDIREFFAEIHDAVCEETVGGDHDAVAFLIEFPHDILQIRPDKRLAAGDICKIHSRQLPYCLDRYFFFRSGRCLIAIAHGTSCITAICNNNRSVQLLFLSFFSFILFPFFCVPVLLPPLECSCPEEGFRLPV